jgi:hypothetical protein
MSEMGFEPTTPVFEEVKPFLVSDRSATAIGARIFDFDLVTLKIILFCYIGVNITVLLVVTPCSFFDRYRHFGGICYTAASIFRISWCGSDI